MKAAGYVYVNVDDCWMAMNRTAGGRLTHDPDRFPSGMKSLAGYVHSRGLHFGLYSARCGHTCQGRPGSQDHEWVDAETFSTWDVDVSYHHCMLAGVQALFALLGQVRRIEAPGLIRWFCLDCGCGCCVRACTVLEIR
jgi:alpha-galactosidase